MFRSRDNIKIRIHKYSTILASLLFRKRKTWYYNLIRIKRKFDYLKSLKRYKFYSQKFLSSKDCIN